MTDTRTNVWPARRSRRVTLSAISVAVISILAPVAHTDILGGSDRPTMPGAALYADEHVIAFFQCMERIDTLTKLQAVYTQQLALLQPDRPPAMQPPTNTQPPSLEGCLAQEDVNKRLVAVYEAMIRQLSQTHTPQNAVSNENTSKAALHATDATKASQ